MQSMKYNVYEEAENRQIYQNTFVPKNGGDQPSDKAERRFGQNCVKGIAVILLLAAAIAVLATIFTLHLQLKDTWHREYENIAENLEQIKEMNSNGESAWTMTHTLARSCMQDYLEIDLHSTRPGVGNLRPYRREFVRPWTWTRNSINSAKFDIAVRKLNDTILQLEDASAEKFRILESTTNHPSTCKELKRKNVEVKNGLYVLQDVESNVFQTYCDMSTDHGGWTLVASVHENYMKGRCTAGDRWSSEQGYGVNINGDGFWENRAIHGSPATATSDDYKNYAYFTMNASDIMIWQVPNDTPMPRFESSSFLKFHTTSGFLNELGGNLRSLFSNHYNIKAGTYLPNLGNGPTISISWDRGSNEELLEFFPPNVKAEVDAGFVQFRAINHERNAFALCPGVKMKSGKANAEHVCIGSTGETRTDCYCGDFAGRYCDDVNWQLNERLVSSVVMIFYR